MDLLQCTEAAQKLGKLQALSDAIVRAKESGEVVVRPSGRSHYKYTPTQAGNIARLEQQYRALRATMPLRAVT